MFNIFKVSVPMPTLLPMDTDDGTLATYISVVNPAVGAADIVEIVVVTNVVTPTWKLPFNEDISVLKPEMLTKSPGSKVWLLGVNTLIIFSDHLKTEFSNVSKEVSTFVISFPPISDMSATNPSPFVFVLSNSNTSSIL